MNEAATSGSLPQQPVVRTRGVRKLYGTHAALDGVDLEVQAGAVYGLVGPNGSGKTTLLSILAGLRRVTSGDVELNVPHARIGLLPDTPEFEPWLTATEVVDLSRNLVDPGIPRERVHEALIDAGLGDALDRRCGGFSRGMLQRLGVAATLVSEPSLLLMDEPASALDPAGRREILNLIAEQRGRRTVIFSSHILADVQEVCDTVGVMQAGRLIYQGSLDALLTGEATPTYYVRLRGDESAARAEFERAPWVTAVEVVAPGELRLSVTELGEAEREISGALDRAGARVVSVRPEEASLERAFLELTAGSTPGRAAVNLWRLEYLRLRRTWRGPGLTVIFLFFGVLGPITARYIEQILTSFGTQDVQITFPPPVPADGMIQYLGNAQQVGLLAVIAVAAGALSIDGTADIAIFLRTRVSSTARLVLTRYAVYAIVAALAWTAGALVAWYETWALIGGLPADRVLLGAALGGIYFAYVVAIVALASGITRGSVGTMFLAFAIVLVPQITLGLVGGLGDWLPGHLSGAIAALNDGSADPVDYVRSVLVTVVVIVAALAAAVRLLDRREV